MTAPSCTASMGTGRRVGLGVPVGARELAVRLSSLFERDVEIVKRLNDAQRWLREANERLWSGLAPDAFGLLCDGAAPAGESQIARLVGDTGSARGRGSETDVLEALQRVHWAIHRAFCAYQSACEERRQLAFEVGELSQQLTEALCAAGWSAQEARNANVHELARGGIR